MAATATETLLWDSLAAAFEPPAPTAKRLRWLQTARPEQTAPWNKPGWFVWLILAGRGFGKTRSGSEHVAEFAREHPGAQIAVVGRTDAEARRILLNGPSGLKSVLEAHEIKRCVESPGDTQLELANGSLIYVVGANSPDALRGLNLDMAWCDELAAWRYQTVVWDEVLMPAVRVGARPHILVTTTPKPTRLVKQLLKDDTTHVTRGSTFDNAKNLAKSFLDQMRRKYDGTRAGRQELYAEILDDTPGALVTRAELEAGRVDALTRDMAPTIADHEHPAAALREVVVALDPSDGDEDSDEQALAVIGRGWDHELYVVESDGGRWGAVEFVRKGLQLAHDLGATLIVEKNHGGKYLVATIEQVMRDLDYTVPYRVVNASQGKRTRAEPAGALIEQGKLHMVGYHTELEDQLTMWTGAPGESSPDRLDAMVWGVSHFLRHELGPEAEDDAAHEYAPTPPRPTHDDTPDADGVYGYATDYDEDGTYSYGY